MREPQIVPGQTNPKCKVCKRVQICMWCDDHERMVCVFCMTPEHHALWDARVKELQGQMQSDLNQLA